MRYLFNGPQTNLKIRSLRVYGSCGLFEHFRKRICFLIKTETFSLRLKENPVRRV